MKTRTWVLAQPKRKYDRSNYTYGLILVEQCPRKRSVWLDIHEPARYFLQFPWTYLCFYTYDRGGEVSCPLMTAWSRLSPLESHEDRFYALQCVNGPICGGNSLYYQTGHRNYYDLVTQGLDFYWNTAFYKPDPMHLAYWNTINNDQQLARFVTDDFGFNTMIWPSGRTLCHCNATAYGGSGWFERLASAFTFGVWPSIDLEDLRQISHLSRPI
jgi:hypothetical protein